MSIPQVNDVAFSHNHGNKLGSNYFVTVHHRRVQYWYYDTNSRDGKVSRGVIEIYTGWVKFHSELELVYIYEIKLFNGQEFCRLIVTN